MNIDRDSIDEAMCAGPQRVIQAAVKMRDGQIITLPRPMRHHNIRNYVFRNPETKAVYEPPLREEDIQGFILSNGNFASRGTSFKHMKASGQIPTSPYCLIGSVLTSEDVYDFHGYCIWAPEDDNHAIRPKMINRDKALETLKSGPIGVSYIATLYLAYFDQMRNMERYNGGHFTRSPLYSIYSKNVAAMVEAMDEYRSEYKNLPGMRIIAGDDILVSQAARFRREFSEYL